MISEKEIKVLFVCPSFSSFIQNDLDILRKHFDVRVAHYQGKKRVPKFLIETLKGVLWADITFSWFADVHAFATVLFSKIFKRKSIVVVGGYEVAKVPEINYGGMLSRRKTFIVKFVLKHADKVLTVDDSLKKDAIKNAKVNGENIKTVPTGYDTKKINMNDEKENLVITVSYITDNIIKRKGLDTFVKAAKYLPDVEFVLIGKYADNSIEYLKSIASPNVKFTGFVPEEDLLRYYQKAKVYCQLSRYEGLPNALCEAMLCGCVPVGTNYCGIPTAIGENGFYVPYGEPKATAEAIKKALKSNKGKEARERIRNMFPMEKRKKELIESINEVLKCKSQYPQCLFLRGLLKFIKGVYNMTLFKHDLILNFCKNKKILHIGATDNPYHLERFKTGTLLHLKLQKNCKEVIGMDADKKSIEELRNLGINNIFYGDICKDSYEINLKDMKFDYIVFSDVIEHLDNPGLALTNIKKIMGKDAKLILTTPNVFSYTNIMAHITGKENVHPDHTFQPSYKTMRKLFEKNDLKVDYFTYCFWGSHEESDTWKMRLFCKLIANRRKYVMPVLFFILEVK